MPDLSSNSRRLLLDLAAQAIKEHLVSGDHPDYKNAEAELEQCLGCFVTLKKQGQLRGCVGTFESSKPLYQNVIRMAVAAAFQDMRFPPVSKQELKDLEIQISVLGVPFEMKSFDDLEIGRHGVWVKLGEQTGTYLPEVAVEQDWTPVEFITHCAREKAGLSPDECARAVVFLYEVDKISRDS